MFEFCAITNDANNPNNKVETNCNERQVAFVGSKYNGRGVAFDRTASASLRYTFERNEKIFNFDSSKLRHSENKSNSFMFF